MSTNKSSHRWHAWAAAVVFATAILPLVVGLDRWDMRSDEAIYSYAVERMLETGDWLTPRNIPNDFAFLEKPPLKFWLVAGAMRMGLLPVDEFGMRAFDAIFGAIAFGYVLAFGLRLAGPLCGGVALAVFLAFDPLIFEHGLRSNNMEAALFLSYCGGMFHAWSWAGAVTGRSRSGHAMATAAYATLGFMTKFVAVAFLPLAFLAWLLSSASGRQRLLSGWRDWVVPIAVSLSLAAPWFVYQWVQNPEEFWEIIFGQHVYVRFTASLDPTHLAPWHYYFSETWRELVLGGAATIVAAGVVLLAWRAAKGHALVRLLILWWLLPMVLVSLGTSKLLHYAYPFLPPLALGAGLFVAASVEWATGTMRRIRWPLLISRSLTRPLAANLSLALAATCLGLAIWTAVFDEPARIYWGDTLLFRNSSVARPTVIAVVALAASGYHRAASAVVGCLLILMLVPFRAYPITFAKALRYDRPQSAATQCLLQRQDRGASPRSGMFISDWRIVAHPPYYYFRHLGPWEPGGADWLVQVLARIEREDPAIVAERHAASILAAVRNAGGTPPDAIRLEAGVLLLLPGGQATCSAAILRHGGSAFDWTSVGH